MPIYWLLYSSIRLFVNLYVSPSVCLYAPLFLCLPPSLSLCPSLSVCLYAHPFFYVFFHPSIQLSICPSFNISVCPSVRLSKFVYLFLSVCLSSSADSSVCLSISFYVSLSYIHPFVCYTSLSFSV